MAKVKTKNPNIKETTIFNTKVVFDDDSIAEVTDEEVLKVLKDVGEATGQLEIVEEAETDTESSKTKKASAKKNPKTKA